jgi:hypothetical protein
MLDLPASSYDGATMSPEAADPVTLAEVRGAGA